MLVATVEARMAICLLTVSVILLCFAVGGDCKSKIVPASECKEYPCLIFADNFDSLDFSTWQHEVTMVSGGNGEFQYYANNRSNSFIRDGALYLKPTLTTDTYGEGFLTSGTLDLWSERCTSHKDNYGCYLKGTEQKIINPVQSARIRTYKSFNFKYGKIEARVKIPRGDWLWPAIWLMPRHEAYGDWPSSGEIDLLEARGNDDLQSPKGNQVGNKMVLSTIHWGPFNMANSFPMTTGSLNAKKGSFADDYHVYSLEWTESGMHFSVDDITILKFTVPDGGFWELGEFEKHYPGIANPWVGGGKMAPFDEEFYIIMNVAVGGVKFFDDSNTPTKPWKNDSPRAIEEFWAKKEEWYKTWVGDDSAMKVDYVKVWKLKSDESDAKENSRRETSNATNTVHDDAEFNITTL